MFALFATILYTCNQSFLQCIEWLCIGTCMYSDYIEQEGICVKNLLILNITFHFELLYIHRSLIMPRWAEPRRHT